MTAPRKPSKRAAPAVEHAKGYQIIRHRGGHAQLIGYARVSTREQSLDVQLRELEAAGCCRVYAETVSSVGHRPGWGALMADIRRGDTVVCVRLDRIGRKLGEVVAACDVLTGEGAYVRSIAQGIDTRSAGGRLLLPIWAALAETERTLLIERTRAGLDAARARGKTFGRPTVLTRARIDLCVMLRAQGHSIAAIATTTGLSNGSVRTALERGAPEGEKRQLRLSEVT